MIKAIMAVDDEGGISKNGTMPWPKNSTDLQWFKKNTLNNVVIMGRLTWIDPLIPTPLTKRINVLITNKDIADFPGADEYISGNLISQIINLSKKYKKIDKLIEEITDTDSQISDKLFYNVKIIKHNKVTVDRIEKFRIE